jgi:hypothetical protein
MKLVVTIAAVCLLASCNSKPREQPPASSPSPAASPSPASPSPASPPATSPPASGTGSAASPAAGAGSAASPSDICQSSLIALDRATCPSPEIQQQLASTKKSLEGVIKTTGTVTDADPRQFQVMCAQLFLAIERDATKLKCTVELDARRRQELTALLDAWYGQRTAVVPTGDAAADVVIAQMAKLRDAACACKDAACLDRLDTQLTMIKAMPANAPDAARTLGSKLLEDAGRCASRVRTLDAPPR